MKTSALFKILAAGAFLFLSAPLFAGPYPGGGNVPSHSHQGPSSGGVLTNPKIGSITPISNSLTVRGNVVSTNTVTAPNITAPNLLIDGGFENIDPTYTRPIYSISGSFLGDIPIGSYWRLKAPRDDVSVISSTNYPTGYGYNSLWLRGNSLGHQENNYFYQTLPNYYDYLGATLTLTGYLKAVSTTTVLALDDGVSVTYAAPSSTGPTVDDSTFTFLTLTKTISPSANQITVKIGGIYDNQISSSFIVDSVMLFRGITSNNVRLDVSSITALSGSPPVPIPLGFKGNFLSSATSLVGYTFPTSYKYNTWAVISSITVTAGNWNMSALYQTVIGTGTVSEYDILISTVISPNTWMGDLNFGANYIYTTIGLASGVRTPLTIPFFPVTVDEPKKTYYLKALITGTGFAQVRGTFYAVQR